MEKNTLIPAVQKAREIGKKRKFKQTFDLIVTLKDVDLKRTENQVDVFAALHYSKGKPSKVCALVGAELIEQAKETCDHSILSDDFKKYAVNKKELKKLAREYDYFIAQGNIMAQVAATFGKFLGPKGKMPNPKAGCVVPPGANLKALSDRLHKLLRITAKTQPVVQVPVGNEDMKDEEIADNIAVVTKTLFGALPNDYNNVKTLLLKLTMSQPVRINPATGAVIETKQEEPVEEKKAPIKAEPKEKAEEPKKEAPKKEAKKAE